MRAWEIIRDGAGLVLLILVAVAPLLILGPLL